MANLNLKRSTLCTLCTGCIKEEIKLTTAYCINLTYLIASNIQGVPKKGYQSNSNLRVNSNNLLYSRAVGRSIMDHSPIRQTFELGKLITNY